MHDLAFIGWIAVHRLIPLRAGELTVVWILFSELALNRRS